MTDLTPPEDRRTPGLRLHPRTMPVQSARAQLAGILIEWQTEHGLTNIEACTVLAEELRSLLKYPLRAERHPDDPDRKADEA
jgi:hypothetical protein